MRLTKDLSFDELYKQAFPEGTYDNSLPQPFFEELLKLGLHDQQFVWHYDTEHPFGRAMARSEVLAELHKQDRLMVLSDPATVETLPLELAESLSYWRAWKELNDAKP